MPFFLALQILLVIGKVAEYLPVSWWLIWSPTIILGVCASLYIAAVAYFFKKVYG